jgi:hypothetical protein
MLGKTSISAIRALLFLAQQTDGGWWSPRRLAAELGESPTYLAKVLRHLARAGIVGVARGVHGISCQVACPVHTDARGYVRAIAEGAFTKPTHRPRVRTRSPPSAGASAERPASRPAGEGKCPASTTTDVSSARTVRWPSAR